MKSRAQSAAPTSVNIQANRHTRMHTCVPKDIHAYMPYTREAFAFTYIHTSIHTWLAVDEPRPFGSASTRPATHAPWSGWCRSMIVPLVGSTPPLRPGVFARLQPC